LAHELKTPISVISSNMDVLKYGFDEKIVKKSKQELKNMTKIID
jgi:signal transduction histidine kinase